MKAYSAVLLAAALVLCACGVGSNSEADEQRIKESITHLVRNESASYSVTGEDEFRDEVHAFYEQREYRPAWVSGADSRKRLNEVLDVFCRADQEGLRRGDYVNAALQRRIDQAYNGETDVDSIRAQALAELDLTVTHTLMDYASDLLTGRVDPREIGTAWKTPVDEFDVIEVLTDTTSDAPLNALSRHLNEQHSEYGELRQALERYRGIAARGGWPNVPAGEALTEGDAGPRVASLIERLAATGDVDSSMIPTSPDSAQYSAAISSGVERFQRRHGIEIDGIAGETLIQRMNDPVEERVRQLELNLERWRWIPSQLGNRYVYVNVPAYELHAFDGGEEVLSMAVVVGEQYEDNATPVFSDTMEYVVFNPYWNVPKSIASEEIVPNARDDRDYLVRNNYEVVAGWQEGADVLDPRSADLDLVENGTHRIRQKPGPQNALGRIKFMFPNEFAIYLHDTPEEHLFQRAERAYSHGCIRIERPVEFGEYVFTSEEWTAARIQQRIDSREHGTEYLESPLPVYILYWTAFVDDEGLVNFREDIYGNDEALDAALQAEMPATDPVPCDSLTAALGA